MCRRSALAALAAVIARPALGQDIFAKPTTFEQCVEKVMALSQVAKAMDATASFEVIERRENLLRIAGETKLYTAVITCDGPELKTERKLKTQPGARW
jgi:hypothetical protein